MNAYAVSNNVRLVIVQSTVFLANRDTGVVTVNISVPAASVTVKGIKVVITNALFGIIHNRLIMATFV